MDDTALNTLLGLSAVVSFIVAFAIGANDVANALGTSVGSGAITFRTATILAGVFEFLGCLTMGAFVSATLKGKIVDPSDWKDEMDLFAIGMFSTLLAAAIWLLVATWFGLPVSTTQTIVGGIIGFGIVEKGAEGVKFSKVLNIVLSWVITPIMGGVIAALFYLLIKKIILTRKDPKVWTYRLMPFLASITLVVMSLFITISMLVKIVPEMNKWWIILVIVVGVAMITGIIFKFIVTPYLIKNEVSPRESIDLVLSSSVIEVSGTPPILRSLSSQSISIPTIDHDTPASTTTSVMMSNEESSLITAERQFKILMLLTASSVAFAHGANDVGNAIGPFSAILEYKLYGEIRKDESIPIYIIIMGGIGIVIGLSTLGQRVIKTVGEKITKLTYTRGYSSEISASITVILSSYLGIPVSTTTTLIGSVTGTGLIKPPMVLPSGTLPNNDDHNILEGKVNYKMLIKIGIGWIFTLIIGGFLTSLFYVIFREIFT